MGMGMQKSWITTVLLCQFLGTLGVHRFYTGRIVSGIFQLLTFGGFGIWTLIDLIMIVSGDFKDQYNRPLDHPPVMGGSRSWVTTAFLCMFLGCDGLRLRFHIFARIREAPIIAGDPAKGAGHTPKYVQEITALWR